MDRVRCVSIHLNSTLQYVDHTQVDAACRVGETAERTEEQKGWREARRDEMESKLNGGVNKVRDKFRGTGFRRKKENNQTIKKKELIKKKEVHFSNPEEESDWTTL